jgi:hypothetical protein
MTKKPFHETTWSNALVGDVALMPWPTGKRIDVVKVEIEGLVTEPGADGALLTIVRFVRDGLHYGQAFNADDTAYIRSRL